MGEQAVVRKEPDNAHILVQSDTTMLEGWEKQGRKNLGMCVFINNSNQVCHVCLIIKRTP